MDSRFRGNDNIEEGAAMKDIQAYLIFDGNCQEAMTFYAKHFEGKLDLMTFGEAPGEMPSDAKDRIMHARLTKGPTITLMASDSMPGMAHQVGDNVFISVQCDTVEEIEKFFTSFSEKAKIIKMPLQETFWAQRFAMLTDQFGINWMFNLDKAH
jgi:PhnB protein